MGKPGTKPGTKPTEISEAQIIREIGAKILSDSSFAIHVLRTIWGAQQPVEKFTGEYAGSDGLGFQEWETRKWNRVYDRAEESGWRFTPRELDEIREGMHKYRTQFRKITRPKVEEERRRMEA